MKLSTSMIITALIGAAIGVTIYHFGKKAQMRRNGIARKKSENID